MLLSIQPIKINNKSKIQIGIFTAKTIKTLNRPEREIDLTFIFQLKTIEPAKSNLKITDQIVISFSHTDN